MRTVSTTKALLAVIALAAATLAASVTVTLQNGSGGYTGCVDRELKYLIAPFSDTGILVEEK